LTGLPESGVRRNYLRHFLLATLAGVVLFSAALLISSRDASSDRPASTRSPYSDDLAPDGPVGGLDKGPELKRYDFRFSGADTFYRIMSLFDVPGDRIQGIVRTALPVYDLRMIKEDTVLSVFARGDDWQGIEYRFSDFEVLRVERGTEAPVARKVELERELRETSASGVIETSLYEAGVKAGADPTAVMTLSDIFAWDVDFASDVRKGDTFSVLYEMLYVEGRPVRTGRVLGAEMVNEGKRFVAIYYEGADGKGGYYDLDGRSLSRTLLKSPLRYRRISSHFTKRRFHPILKSYRPHHGIDYSAPTGTPVEAAGSGRVSYAGWKSGYGNYVEIRHSNNYTTAYGHLSRMGKGVRTGARVDQGDVIGYVGSTGISTGPHLHYEVRSMGRLVNPLGIKSRPKRSLAKTEIERFASIRDAVAGRLGATGGTVMASSSRPVQPGVRF
jgi:murein DD-endopeptidase MepM/ murein hydrolase activator NlpD